MFQVDLSRVFFEATTADPHSQEGGVNAEDLACLSTRYPALLPVGQRISAQTVEGCEALRSELSPADGAREVG